MTTEIERIAGHQIIPNIPELQKPPKPIDNDANPKVDGVTGASVANNPPGSRSFGVNSDLHQSPKDQRRSGKKQDKDKEEQRS